MSYTIDVHAYIICLAVILKPATCIYIDVHIYMYMYIKFYVVLPTIPGIFSTAEKIRFLANRD